METNPALYRDTVGNPQWLARHRSDIESSFPLEWANASMEVTLRVGLKLKLCNANWHELDELTFFIARFIELGWAQVRAIPGAIPQVRRRPNPADRAAQLVLNTTPDAATVAQANDVLRQFRLPQKS